MAHPDRSLSDPDDADDPLDGLAGLRPVSTNGLVDRWEDLRQRLLTSPGRAAALVLGILAAAAVGWWFLRPPAPPVESTLPLASADGVGDASGSSTPAGSAGAAAATTSTTEVTSTSLVVQAAGAVNRGGVYRLAPGARVDDLIRQAGGLAGDADADRVNLAAPLSDGERVWVPRKGELDSPEVVAGGGGGAAASSGAAGGAGGAGGAPEPLAIVNLNTASAEELDTLPGVGPATAAAILAYRSEHGQFSSVDELLEVRGIGDAKLEALRAAVTV